MSAGLLPRALGLGGLVWLLMTSGSLAQIHPMTSGSSWFYSPSHHSPFNQFRGPSAARSTRSTPPCPRLAQQSHKLGQPC